MRYSSTPNIKAYDVPLARSIWQGKPHFMDVRAQWHGSILLASPLWYVFSHSCQERIVIHAQDWIFIGFYPVTFHKTLFLTFWNILWLWIVSYVAWLEMSSLGYSNEMALPFLWQRNHQPFWPNNDHKDHPSGRASGWEWLMQSKELELMKQSQEPGSFAGEVHREMLWWWIGDWWLWGQSDNSTWTKEWISWSEVQMECRRGRE